MVVVHTAATTGLMCCAVADGPSTGSVVADVIAVVENSAGTCSGENADVASIGSDAAELDALGAVVMAGADASPFSISVPIADMCARL